MKNQPELTFDTIKRMEDMAYLPNIYVLGEAGVQKFCEVFIKVAQ